MTEKIACAVAFLLVVKIMHDILEMISMEDGSEEDSDVYDEEIDDYDDDDSDC